MTSLTHRDTMSTLIFLASLSLTRGSRRLSCTSSYTTSSCWVSLLALSTRVLLILCRWEPKHEPRFVSRSGSAFGVQLTPRLAS